MIIGFVLVLTLAYVDVSQSGNISGFKILFKWFLVRRYAMNTSRTNIKTRL